MLSERDVNSLKLHIDARDIVWYANGIGPVVKTGLTLVEFLVQPMARDVTHVRAIGCKANVPAILAFYALGLGKDTPTVEVCTPLVCSTNYMLNIPELAIISARVCDLVPSVGGWHTFGRLDYPSYALANMFNHGTATSERILPLLHVHPAWNAISFVPHIKLCACARLLGLILDPRWYIDTAHTARNSKLNAFLGLFPRNQRFIQANPAGGSRKAVDRCQLVWDTLGLEEPNRGSIYDPAFFLARLWHNKQGDWKGALRTSQLFVSYLRYNWLDVLYEEDNRLNESLFVPEQFFKTAAEAAAFRAHVGTTPYNESKQ